MLNRNLCDSDIAKQAHLYRVDQKVMELLSYERISIAAFEKINILRCKQKVQDEIELLEVRKPTQDNFFLQNSDSEDEGEDSKNSKVTKPDSVIGQAILDAAQSEMNIPQTSLVDIKKELSGEYTEFTAERKEEAELIIQKKYEQNAEKGYFLQSIMVEQLTRKIYLYNNMIQQMREQLRDEILEKKKKIRQVEILFMENTIKEPHLVCAVRNCNKNLGPIKNFTYIAPNMHHMRCSFAYARQRCISELTDE